MVRSGVGKVNAAVCTQILIDRFNVGCVINTGVAGSLSDAIEIGDIVISDDLVHHDMDAQGFGYPLGQVPQMSAFSFKADERMTRLADEACRRVNPEIGVHHGRIVSGDQFIADQDKKKYLIEHFNALCTEMEGASIAHAAYLNHVPFVVLRAISDKANGSSHVDYPVFEAEAARHCALLTMELVRNL